MRHYFPKHSVEWQEPTVFRRFSLSLWEVAIITGVLLRLYRALVQSAAATSSSWLWAGATIALGLLILCAAATIHLANYPVRQWTWRAPVFALIEVAAESVASLLLIWLGREPMGSTRAEWGHWLPLISTTLWTRLLTVSAWALVLAAVVAVVRRTVLHDEPIQEETPEEIAQET